MAGAAGRGEMLPTAVLEETLDGGGTGSSVSNTSHLRGPSSGTLTTAGVKGGLGQRRKRGAFGLCVVFKAMPASKCPWGHRMVAVPPIRALPQARRGRRQRRRTSQAGSVLFLAFLEIPTGGSTSLPWSGLSPTATPKRRENQEGGLVCWLPRDPSGRGLGKVLERQPAHSLPHARRARTGTGRPGGDSCRKPSMRG